MQVVKQLLLFFYGHAITCFVLRIRTCVVADPDPNPDPDKPDSISPQWMEQVTTHSTTSRSVGPTVLPVQWQTALEHLSNSNENLSGSQQTVNLRNSNEDTSLEPEANGEDSTDREIVYAHDIYTKIHGPRRISFGHEEESPSTHTKSFNERDEGNNSASDQQFQRYSGKVRSRLLKKPV